MSTSSSTSALLRANEAALKTFLSDPSGRMVGIQPPPGLPPEGFGQWYYALHDGGVSGDLATNGLSNDRLHAVALTITARKANTPRDRKGAALVSPDDLTDQAEKVADFLHMNYDVMNAANALITGTPEYAAVHGGDVTTNGFSEPLRFHGQTPPGGAPPQSPDDDGEAEGAPPEILVVVVTLGDARRVRYL